MPKLKQVSIDIDVHRAIEQGRRSFSEPENDILRRLLGIAPMPAQQKPVAQTRDAPVRSRGLWSVELLGKRSPAANLKDAYRTLLIALAERDPKFLSAFSEEKSRSRWFVARSPQGLYETSPHLADEFAEKLSDGWYFDTNLSTEQVAVRVRVAARIAGLNYGRDVKVLQNLKQI